jgi:hypothetical protein
VCGYGAPGKENELFNYCGIGTDFLDRNPYQHGRHTPGTHISVDPVSMRPGGPGRNKIVPIPHDDVINPRKAAP